MNADWFVYGHQFRDVQVLRGEGNTDMRGIQVDHVRGTYAGKSQVTELAGSWRGRLTDPCRLPPYGARQRNTAAQQTALDGYERSYKQC